MSETKRLHAQVAVVGAGSGGFAVAYTLAKQGVKTIVIEKNLGFGGTSVYGGVNCWEPGVASGELHWLIYEKLSTVPNACAVCESVSDPRYPWGLSVPSKESRMLESVISAMAAHNLSDTASLNIMSAMTVVATISKLPSRDAFAEEP